MIQIKGGDLDAEKMDHTIFATPHSRINPYDVDNEFTLKKISQINKNHP
ncbi:hypothetical protein LOS20_02040 [Enterococcus faecium]|nr:hypothetical protein [Enterococcus faecium]